MNNRSPLTFIVRLCVLLALAALASVPSLANAAYTSDRMSATPIVAGDTTTFVLHDGLVSGWGFDWDRRLGNGLPRAVRRDAPVAVAGLTGVRMIASGYAHMLALKDDGTVWAWGGNDFGQIGDGTTAAASMPKQVAGLTNIKNIGTGAWHSFARAEDGTLYAWGRNDRSQLGLGNAANNYAPTAVSGLPAIASVSGGWFHSLAIDNSGRIWAWGFNGYGQVGNGSWTSTAVPVLVPGPAGITQVSGGRSHSLARDANGNVWAWGRDIMGQLGNDAGWRDSNVPVRLTTISDVVEVAAGQDHSLAVTRSGEVWGWGSNQSGQLGIAGSANQFIPVKAPIDDVIVHVTAGTNHSMAVGMHGPTYGWGDNSDGRLGIGSHGSVPVAPTKALYAYTYDVLVLRVSRAQTEFHTSTLEAELSPHLLRLSYGKLHLKYDFAPVYQATPSDIGCDGTLGDLRRILQKALNQARINGVDTLRYAHIFTMAAGDLIEFAPDGTNVGCNIGGTSGGQTTDSILGVQPGTGWATQRSSAGVHSVHEFEHGYGSSKPGGVWSHVGVMACSGVPPSCVKDDNAPKHMNALGDGPDPSSSDDTFNECAAYKDQWHWIAPGRVAKLDGIGTFTFDIYAIDTPMPPANGVLALRIPLPGLGERSYYLEYRTQAKIVIGAADENRPGVYAYYVEGGKAFMLQIGNDMTTFRGLAPLTSVPTNLQNDLAVSVVDVNALRARVEVTVSGPH